MARIFVEEGRRRFNNTGYGALSRSIILALHRHSEHEVFVGNEQEPYKEGIPHVEELAALRPYGDLGLGKMDAILRVGAPKYYIEDRRPSLHYTQNALGDLPEDWVRNLAPRDTLIVPGEFDREVFARHHDHVEVCPQHVDTEFFKPMPKYRGEGPDAPSFLFVGSYSYRKGVDLILDAFRRAFDDGTPAHLHMHCFSGLKKATVTHLLDHARALHPNSGLSFFSGTASLPWMRRFLNRYDAVVSLSRGEGWCMPLWEGLLCGLPVIAPDSTAMGEYLPQPGVRRVSVSTRSVGDLDEDFAMGMAHRYGSNDNTFPEPDLHDAAAAFRDVRDNLEHYKKQAGKGREIVRREFSLERMGTTLDGIIDRTLARLDATG